MALPTPSHPDADPEVKQEPQCLQTQALMSFRWRLLQAEVIGKRWASWGQAGVDVGVDGRTRRLAWSDRAALCGGPVPGTAQTCITAVLSVSLSCGKPKGS